MECYFVGQSVYSFIGYAPNQDLLFIAWTYPERKEKTNNLSLIRKYGLNWAIYMILLTNYQE